MQSSHAAAKIDIGFDDPNLIADAGLVPVMALAERVGLPGLVTDRVKITDAANSGGANAAAKVMSLLAGMVAGADSIADTDRLRYAAMDVAFEGVRAPSTVGTFLRSFTHGHVRQLHSVHRQVLAELAGVAPLLPGAEVLAFVDIDSTHRQVYGYGKQGAAVGRLKGTKTLHPLLATLSTPIAAPVIAGIRLRKGKSADVRGAAAMVAEALATAHTAGCTGAIVVRGDSKFYTAEVAAAAARAGAYVSLTTGSNPSVDAAITTIDPQAWTAIHYPNAFVDEDTGELISDAEVAEIPYTAFSSRPKKWHVPGRLIVRRVNDSTPPAAAARENCSTPGVTTRSSSPARTRCCRPRPSTAATPSSNNSSPTPRTAPWPPALRRVRRQRRLGHRLGHRPQPHPRHRRAGLPLPHQGHHRHHPRAPDQHPGPAGPPRPTTHTAPTRPLALGRRLPATTRRHRPPTTRPRQLTRPNARPGPTSTATVEKAGQTGRPPTPEPSHNQTKINNVS